VHYEGLTNSGCNNLKQLSAFLQSTVNTDEATIDRLDHQQSCCCCCCCVNHTMEGWQRCLTADWWHLHSHTLDLTCCQTSIKTTDWFLLTKAWVCLSEMRSVIHTKQPLEGTERQNWHCESQQSVKQIGFLHCFCCVTATDQLLIIRFYGQMYCI